MSEKLENSIIISLCHFFLVIDHNMQTAVLISNSKFAACLNKNILAPDIKPIQLPKFHMGGVRQLGTQITLFKDTPLHQTKNKHTNKQTNKKTTTTTTLSPSNPSKELGPVLHEI